LGGFTIRSIIDAQYYKKLPRLSFSPIFIFAETFDSLRFVQKQNLPMSIHGFNIFQPVIPNFRFPCLGLLQYGFRAFYRQLTSIQIWPDQWHRYIVCTKPDKQ